MDNLHHYLYKITNLINGKIYIGIRTSKVEPHLDSYLGSGARLKKAKKKYGYKNFKKEILFLAETREELEQMERLIVDEEFVNDEMTYNLALGGNGGLLGEDNPFYGKTHSPEVMKLIKEKSFTTTHPLYGLRGKDHPCYGFKHTKETIEKLAAHSRGENNKQYGKRGELSTRFKHFFNTPWGVFESSRLATEGILAQTGLTILHRDIQRLCKLADTEITKKSKLLDRLGLSGYLGKTYRDIGFYNTEKNHVNSHI